MMMKKVQEMLESQVSSTQGHKYQAEITADKRKLDNFLDDLDSLFERIVSQQEKAYLKGTLAFITTKENELSEVIRKLRIKNDSVTDKDREIINLKKTIILVKQEIYEADNTRIKNIELTKQCRDVYHQIV